MELEGNSNSGTSVLFLRQLRERHAGPLHVIWDNAPAHRGEAVREYLGTPGLGLRLVNLPGYSPDFNADEAVWGWVREDATGNLSLGTCAWGPRLGCRRGSGTSSPRWPAGSRRSNAAAAPSCNQGLKSYCGTPSPIANPSQMHIPPWLWFSLPLPSAMEAGTNQDVLRLGVEVPESASGSRSNGDVNDRDTTPTPTLEPTPEPTPEPALRPCPWPRRPYLMTASKGTNHFGVNAGGTLRTSS